MPSSSKKRRRRKKLWLENPHCHWCGILTVLIDNGNGLKKHPDNMATIDHVKSRYDKTRRKNNVWVLACRKCNQKRNNEETKSIPLEELRERAKRHNKIKRSKPSASNKREQVE